VSLLQWPGRRLFVQHLLDDWIFARRYIHGEDAVLGPRLDRAAERLCEAARAGEAAEVLVLGHSLGAVLAIDLLDRALRLEPRLGQDRSAVAFISVGSSIPKIGLHRAAARFRAAVERVANAPAIFWGEYQTLTDVMSFYKVDPVTDMGLKGRSPVIRQVRVKATLQSDLEPELNSEQRSGRGLHRNSCSTRCLTSKRDVSADRAISTVP
jgi:pimeloyl-ACP methyl ester carboxylesterase